MMAVNVENISRTFGRKNEFYALKNVSFDVKRGEIFGLLGPNGAGKTTLLNILTTVITPTDGTAKIFGLDINTQKEGVRELINSGSYESEFHWAMKVRDILKTFGKFYGLNGNKLESRINFLAEKFEIKEILNDNFAWLSSGQKMRMILCKSLINNPRCVMLDEPTANLDPDIADKTRKTILEISREFKTTILLSSHIMHEVEELCNRIAFINRGQIVDIGKLNKIKSRKLSSFKIFIKLKQIKDKQFLKSLGFQISRNMISRELDREDKIAPILSALVKHNYQILDMEVQRPSLEDYFLEMVRK